MQHIHTSVNKTIKLPPALLVCITDCLACLSVGLYYIFISMQMHQSPALHCNTHITTSGDNDNPEADQEHEDTKPISTVKLTIAGWDNLTYTSFCPQVCLRFRYTARYRWFSGLLWWWSYRCYLQSYCITASCRSPCHAGAMKAPSDTCWKVFNSFRIFFQFFLVHSSYLHHGLVSTPN